MTRSAATCSTVRPNASHSRVASWWSVSQRDACQHSPPTTSWSRTTQFSGCIGVFIDSERRCSSSSAPASCWASMRKERSDPPSGAGLRSLRRWPCSRPWPLDRPRARLSLQSRIEAHGSLAIRLPCLGQSWLEQLNRVTGWVFEQDLLAADSDHDVAPKPPSSLAKVNDRGDQVGDFKRESIPT